MSIKRQDSEPPLATSEWGWRYHHIGIPTDKPINGENTCLSLNYMFPDLTQVRMELNG